MKLAQAKIETPRELGTRATKLSALAFPEEAKENADIQAQLADLFVNALEKERIRYNVIKEAPIRL